VEVFELVELEVSKPDWSCKITFSSAQLVVVSEMGSRLWYVDVNGIAQQDMLADFNDSEDIRVDLRAVSAGGRMFSGIGYLHPNVAHHAAAIRGDDKLIGY
jgi:hypothetical protein